MALTRPRRWAATATAFGVAVAALTAGCGAGHATKAGKENPQVVVLRMASGSADLSYEPAVGYLVRRVHELSHGRVRIDVVNDWDLGDPMSERQIVRDVARDKADLGWVGTRVFDTLGDGSFQALTAPMLIDSYPLERAVIASDMPRQMLRSLSALGVAGLAVLGDGLRKPVAVRRPLLRPDDWRRLTFATFPSRGQAEAIRALGARPRDSFGARLLADIDRGTVQGFEKNLLVYQINGMEDAARFVTANVNLWPQTVALVANPRRLSSLHADQRAWIRRAAAEATVRSTSFFDDDASIAAAVCKNGARFANASAADLRALRRAFAPVYATLERDPPTKTFIASIERLKRSTAPGPPLSIPAACTARAETGNSAVVGDRQTTVLDGVWRIAWTEAELYAAGTSRLYAKRNHGIVTLTLKDGRARYRFESPPDCTAAYAVSGQTVFFGIPSRPCQGTVRATWTIQGDKLRLRNVRATDGGDRVFWGGKPWTKIG
jgi:TRAP-type C4-dicarboxylate transport system substrate-binding protein